MPVRQIFPSPLVYFTHFYCHPHSLGPSIQNFQFYSWSKFRTVPLFMCWSLYQTPPSSILFWYQYLCFTHTVPIYLQYYLSHWKVCITHGGWQSHFSVPDLHFFPIFVILGHRQVTNYFWTNLFFIGCCNCISSTCAFHIDHSLMPSCWVTCCSSVQNHNVWNID